MVSLRCAAYQEPGASRPPRVGGEPLRFFEGAGVRGPDVDPLDQGREVHVQRFLPQGVDHGGVGADSAFMPGDGQACRLARSVLAKRVDVWHPVLIHDRNLARAGRGRWVKVCVGDTPNGSI